MPGNYTAAVLGTSNTCSVLNLATLCRELLQKLLSAMFVVIPLPFRLRSLVILNCNESMEAVDNEASDPKCELVFSQLVRVLGKLLEKCFRGDMMCNFSL